MRDDSDSEPPPGGGWREPGPALEPSLALGRPASPHLDGRVPEGTRAPDRGGANVAAAKRVPSISADPASTLAACPVGTASFTRSPETLQRRKEGGGAVEGGAVTL